MNDGKVAILGMGISGRSVLRYFLSEGIYPICVDASESLLTPLESHGLLVLKDDSDVPNEIGLIVCSPGISHNHPWIQFALSQGIPLTSELELACKIIRPRCSCLGITGTNGKTTTTLFTNHLLNMCGRSSLAVGNIGLPLLDVCHRNDVDSFVIEMSSFQLVNFKENWRFLSGAAILNYSANHLDYHISMESYYKAKEKILDYLLPQGKAYVCSDFSNSKSESLTVAVEEFQETLSQEEELLSSLYPHDLENYAIGYALARLITIVDKHFLIRALGTFTKPPHKLELVADYGCVSFINDSKSTTVASVLTAISVLNAPQILILGGRNKGGDFALLIPSLRDKVRLILIIGESQDEIEFALQGSCDLIKFKNLSEAVMYAVSAARPGDIVLLSPGCSSLDQFSNYEERGNVFKELVFDLTGEKV